MTGRTRLVFWLVFCGVQLLGWIFLNVRDMFAWLGGVLLLFPGFLLAIALDAILNRVPTLVVRFAVTVACNAIFWFACSAAWRKLRGNHQV